MPKSGTMADALAPSTRHEFRHDGRLVYTWDQTLSDVNMYVEVPPGVRAKDLFCEIKHQSISLGLKPNPPYLQARAVFAAAVVASCASFLARIAA